MLAGAVCAAVVLAISNFHTMTNNLASAVRARWRHRMDGTLEAVKCAALALHDDRKRLIIFISTDITLRHLSSFLLGTNLAQVLRPSHPVRLTKKRTKRMGSQDF